MGKSVYDKIKEAQLAGTFEGSMKAHGRNIRYFADEYFKTHTTGEIAKELNQEEYEYYHSQVKEVVRREEKENREKQVKEINDFLMRVEQDKEQAIEQIMKKYQALPAPIRPTKEKTIQDIKHLVGQPFIGDLSYQERLKEYVGEVESGNIPVDVGIETK